MFVFCGDKKSGKSNLILKFLDIQITEDVKETAALDFRFGSKKREEQKVRIQSYELGGGRVLASMLGATLRNVDDIGSICIVLDLSKPGNCVESLLFWIKAVRAYADNALKEL